MTSDAPIEPATASEGQVDEALEESFPASDPAAIPAAGVDSTPVENHSGEPTEDTGPYPFPTADHHPTPSGD